MRKKGAYSEELTSEDVIGKRNREAACASGLPQGLKALPTVSVRVDQHLVVKALVDTGCNQSILSKRLLDRVTVSREKAGRTERGAGAPTKQERIAVVDGSGVSCSVAEVTVCRKQN